MDEFSCPVDSQRIEPLLTTRSLGRVMELHGCIDSTNLRAKQLAATAADTLHGTVVVADSQTAGRGRMTRQWESPPARNLYFSMILQPQVPPPVIPEIAILCAIALHKALANMIPEYDFGLKWPNDLWSRQGRKLSGILCEALFQGTSATVIAGLGINVNMTGQDFPDIIRDTAGSLRDIAGHCLDRNRILASFLNAFEPLLDTWQQVLSLQPFMDYWNAHDILNGTRITVQDGEAVITGTARGIRTDGCLLLETAGNVSAIRTGDTHILKTELRH